MVTKEVSNSLSAQIAQVRIPELQCLQLLIGGLKNLAHLANTVAVNIAVSNVNSLDVGIGPEDVQQKQKVLLANVILRQVDVLNAICVLKRDREVLNSDRVVEKLVECRVLNLLLVLHFDLEHFPLVHVRVPNHILRQINRRDRIVYFQHLRQNEQVFAVQALLSQVELDKLVEADFAHWDLATVHTDSLNIVLVDELGEVLETESVDHLLLIVRVVALD